MPAPPAVAPPKAKFKPLFTLVGAVAASAMLVPSNSVNTRPLEKRPWKYGAPGVPAPSALVAATRWPPSLRLSPNEYCFVNVRFCAEATAKIEQRLNATRPKVR